MTVIHMQSRPSDFGACYECARGFHAYCIGVPCQCICPDMSVQEAFERITVLRDSQARRASYFGEVSTRRADGPAEVFPVAEVYVGAREATGHALNVMAIDVLIAELRRLHALINSPETQDFAKAVVLEAAHQRERWGVEHDERKSPEDWFWLVGYLAGKALRPDQPAEKRLYRIITIAAAAANWHAQAKGQSEAST